MGWDDSKLRNRDHYKDMFVFFTWSIRTFSHMYFFRKASKDVLRKNEPIACDTYKKKKKDSSYCCKHNSIFGIQKSKKKSKKDCIWIIVLIKNICIQVIRQKKNFSVHYWFVSFVDLIDFERRNNSLCWMKNQFRIKHLEKKNDENPNNPFESNPCLNRSSHYESVHEILRLIWLFWIQTRDLIE